MAELTLNGLLGSTFLAVGRRLVLKGVIGDCLLDIIDARTGSTFRVEDPATGDLRLPDVLWIEQLVREGGIVIISDAVGPIAPARIHTPRYDHAQILELDPQAIVRADTMRGLKEAGAKRHDPDLSDAIDAVWTPEMKQKHGCGRPTTATVRQWFDRCGSEEVTLASMMSMSGRGPRAGRLDEAVQKIVAKNARWFYASRGRKQRDVQAAVVDEIAELNKVRAAAGEPLLAAPSRETVRRAINDILCRDTYAEKYGEKRAKARWDASGKGVTAVKILAVGMMDDTVIDGVVVFDARWNLPCGRPWICVIIDVHSRCIVGWFVSFIPPSMYTAAECIRRANRGMPVRPDRLERYPTLGRINGRFSNIITDNGSNYVAPGFVEVLADIGTALTLAPVGTPTYKAMVERFFSTLKTWLLSKIPGATFDVKLLRECGYDPATEAALTLAQLEELITEFIYVYHITPHSGVDMQPVRKWELSMMAHGRPIIADEGRLAVLSRITVPNRRLTRAGIRFENLTYRDTAVVNALLHDSARDEPVKSQIEDSATATGKIKYDPSNLASIHWFNERSGDWVELPCTTPEYAGGLSLWQHRKLRDWTKQQNLAFNTEEERAAARHALNELILENAPDMAANERRAMARMLGGGTPAEPDVTILRAEPRHDGMAPADDDALEQDLPVDERTDKDRNPSRPTTKGRDRRKPEGDETSPSELNTAPGSAEWSTVIDEDLDMDHYS